MAPKTNPTGPQKPVTAEDFARIISEAEQVELDYKRMMTADLRAKMQERDNRFEQLLHEARQRNKDYEAGEKQRRRRRTICKHRKGGRNNNFARGNGNDFSIVINTYSDGRVGALCTRCQSEWWKPTKSLYRTNRKLYYEQQKSWQEIEDMPTDNSPSGSQIYLIETAA